MFPTFGLGTILPFTNLSPLRTSLDISVEMIQWSKSTIYVQTFSSLDLSLLFNSQLKFPQLLLILRSWDLYMTWSFCSAVGYLRLGSSISTVATHTVQNMHSFSLWGTLDKIHQIFQYIPLSLCSLRFEFSVSCEEAGTRKVDVAVKNDRMFHTRERREIGMVM